MRLKVIVKTSSVILFFFILFIFSEVIYTLNNPERIQYCQYFLIKYHISRTIRYAEKGHVEKSINNLFQAAKIAIKLSESQQSENFYPTYNKPKMGIPNVNNLHKDLADYLSGIEKPKLEKPYPFVYMAKIFYYLALIAYKNQEYALVERFLQTSVLLASNYATSHVELANFYQRMGEIDKSKSAYEFCFEFEYPKDYCKYYFNLNFETNTTPEVGFLENDVAIHYIQAEN
ncbi:hypothetical protein A2159_02400 [Candidatus Woesebacteria bacterium RBG_13_34_9]|uniref:Uncharacterized protein n=1 Tax=Candidatus Woesebacteria bacterium RBG_13_34_9 TaxID=1802477 RepID=A0A1F7X348_9BACT|nr:MAG: hypothetical protein A2159_02400 [Candidatus Woesebacteria bacterium RBG_13_34_9]